MHNRKALLAGLVLAFLMGATRASALTVSLPFEYFGHLENAEIDTPTGKHGACAATSYINSFWYLQSQYPAIYDQKLIPKAANDMDGDGDVDADDAMLDAREKLHKKIWATDAYSLVWDEKLKWFETHDLKGSTIFSGMTIKDASTWYKKELLKDKTAPTFEYLWEQLRKKEDIEIIIGPHQMNLTSLKFEDLDKDKKWDQNEPFTDTNFNGVWDAGEPFRDLDGDSQWDQNEPAKIDYLDPNNPTKLFESPLAMGMTDCLQFKWHNDGKNTPQLVSIESAFSESPVPEPVTMLGIFLGVCGVSSYVRRRVKGQV